MIKNTATACKTTSAYLCLPNLHNFYADKIAYLNFDLVINVFAEVSMNDHACPVFFWNLNEN